MEDPVDNNQATVILSPLSNLKVQTQDEQISSQDQQMYFLQTQDEQISSQDQQMYFLDGLLQCRNDATEMQNNGELSVSEANQNTEIGDSTSEETKEGSPNQIEEQQVVSVNKLYNM